MLYLVLCMHTLWYTLLLSIEKVNVMFKCNDQSLASVWSLYRVVNMQSG